MVPNLYNIQNLGVEMVELLALAKLVSFDWSKQVILRSQSRCRMVLSFPWISLHLCDAPILKPWIKKQGKDTLWVFWGWFHFGFKY
jgi:hypothetical protein